MSEIGQINRIGDCLYRAVEIDGRFHPQMAIRRSLLLGGPKWQAAGEPSDSRTEAEERARRYADGINLHRNG